MRNYIFEYFDIDHRFTYFLFSSERRKGTGSNSLDCYFSIANTTGRYIFPQDGFVYLDNPKNRYDQCVDEAPHRIVDCR